MHPRVNDAGLRYFKMVPARSQKEGITSSLALSRFPRLSYSLERHKNGRFVRRAP